MPASSALNPGASYLAPYELMGACHERVERLLRLLLRLSDHLRGHPLDDDARLAARDVMRYFDIAAPLHHEDEELHVFPVLLAQGDAATDALVQSLREDHERLGAIWAEIRAVLRRLESGDDAAQAVALAQRPLWDSFAAGYRSHIDRENGQAYPLAERHTAPETLLSMGREMGARRGVT